MKGRAVRRLLFSLRTWEQQGQAGLLSCSAEAYNEAQRHYYARKAAQPRRGFVDIDDPRLKLYGSPRGEQFWVPGDTEAYERAKQLWKPERPKPRTIRHRLDVPLEPEQRQALHASLHSITLEGGEEIALSEQVKEICIRAVEQGVVALPGSHRARALQPRSQRTVGEDAQVLHARLAALFQVQQQHPAFQVERALARDPLLLRMPPGQVKYSVRQIQAALPDADPGLLLATASRRIRYNPHTFCTQLHELRRTLHQRLGLDVATELAPGAGTYRRQFLQVPGSAAQRKMDQLLRRLMRQEQRRLAAERRQAGAGGRPGPRAVPAGRLEEGSADSAGAALASSSTSSYDASSSSAVVAALGAELDQSLLRGLQDFVCAVYRRCPMLLKYSADTLAGKLLQLGQQLGADSEAVRQAVLRHPSVLAADLTRLPATLQQLQQQLELTQQDAQQLLLAEPALVGRQAAVQGVPQRLQQLQQLLGLDGPDVAVAMVLRHPKLLKAGLPGLQERLQALPGALRRDRDFVRRLLAAHPLLATFTVATLSKRRGLLEQVAGAREAWREELAGLDPRALGRCLLAGAEAYGRLQGLAGGAGAARLAALQGVALQDLVFMGSDQLQALPAQQQQA